MRGLHRCATMLFVCITAGCASQTIPNNQLELSVSSEPPGAMVYFTDTGKAAGMTPKEITWPLTPSDMTKRTLRAQLTALWPSGAQKTEWVVMHPHARRFHFTFSRPINAPNLQVDLAYAMQLQARTAAEKAKADADFAEVMGILLGGVTKAVASRKAPAYTTPLYVPPQNINCVTTGATTTCRVN